MFAWIYKLASPKHFYQTSLKIQRWAWLFFAIFLCYGVVFGLFFAPQDYQQGDAFRIIYVHVPSAVVSLAIYMLMAICAVIALIWRIKLAGIIFAVSAPVGASFTLLALLTGALWGQPTWGTWWLWDARLTSELILLFLYFGVIALRSAITEKDKATKASALLILVGSADLPIIHYSVYWWNTLHQKATILKFQQPSIALEMLWPLLSMIIAFFLFYLGILLIRSRTEILEREYHSAWVKDLLTK